MDKLTVSYTPHIHGANNIRKIMLDVIIALMPASIGAIYFFGLSALVEIVSSVAFSVLFEYLWNKAIKKENTTGDLSAVVTGLLLALTLPSGVPLWMVMIGDAFAIVVVKCFYGGIGQNFANPAITARVFLLISFAGTLGGGAVPKVASNPDLVSGATPLAVISKGGILPSLKDMFLGMRGGAIGETCAVALIAGFIYLVVRKVIYFETPLIYVATVFLLSLIAYNDFSMALYQVLSGGLILGAVFMITDYSTTPITRKGKMIFALGCGLITFLIRYFGSYPEGVSFAILIMNILSPYIEIWTRNRPFGGEIK